MTRLFAALVLLALSGCDMCVAAIEVHQDRCARGEQTSCEWIDDHVVGAYCG
jgi:hypothetical protein